MSMDLLFQNLSTVQSNQQPKPNTIASTTTIAPSTFLTIVSGTNNIATITPPVNAVHMLALVFTTTSPGQLLTTGNVLVGSTTLATNVPAILIYNPLLGKYYLINGAL